MRNALLLLSIPLLLTACGYEEVRLEAIEEVEVREFNAQGIALVAQVRVNNPNGYKLKVRDPEVDLYLNGTRVGRAELDSIIVLRPRGTYSYRVPMRARFEGAGVPLLMVGLGAAFGGEMRLQAKGTVTGQAGLFRRKFPFDMEENIRMR